MKFKTKAALKLAKLARIDLASQALDDITLHFLDGDELVEGIEVFEVNDNGEYTVAPDGKYSWGEQIVTVSEGIVESITEGKRTPKGKSNPKSKTPAKGKNPAKGSARKSQKMQQEEEGEEGEEGGTEEGDNPDESIPQDLSTLIKIVKELVSEVEKLGGDVNQINDELKSARRELSSTKEELKRAKRNSNRDFTAPNPGGSRGVARPFDANKELEKFGLK